MIEYLLMTFSFAIVGFFFGKLWERTFGMYHRVPRDYVLVHKRRYARLQRTLEEFIADSAKSHKDGEK